VSRISGRSGKKLVELVGLAQLLISTSQKNSHVENVLDATYTEFVRCRPTVIPLKKLTPSTSTFKKTGLMETTTQTTHISIPIVVVFLFLASVLSILCCIAKKEP
jgi:hypothetical protein